jgi:hypothetical protein
VKTKRGEVTFAYSSVEATPLQLYVEPTQTIDVLGISGCFPAAFVMYGPSHFGWSFPALAALGFLLRTRSPSRMNFLTT